MIGAVAVAGLNARRQPTERGAWSRWARLVVASWIVLLAGCSNAQLYDMVQSHQEMRCLDLPAAAIQDCLVTARLPYEDYERQAAEVLVLPDGTEGMADSGD